MAGWHLHEGRAVALPLENIDTDQLIPARFMATPRAEGYGTYLLHDLRRDAAGALLAEMPLNAYPEASVLVARRNFGSGSSREAAVYALIDFGIRAVIAPSFGDIFAGNAVNNGLLPLRLAPDRGTLTVAGTRHDVALPPKARQKLLNGWDDIDLTRSHRPDIATFRNTRRTQYPWAWPG